MSSESHTVRVVHTGTANLASVLAAFDRAGVACTTTSDPGDVERAQALVLPGVGSFGAAMAQLREHGLVEPLRARFEAGIPTLAICLGLQLLGDASEETPGERGLGVLPGAVATKFPSSVRVPQLGWNAVEPEPACRVLTRGFAYFANSFKLDAAPLGWSVARTHYASDFISAIERPGPNGATVACQFHPELSGKWGAALIAAWLASAGIPTAAPAEAAR